MLHVTKSQRHSTSSCKVKRGRLDNKESPGKIKKRYIAAGLKCFSIMFPTFGESSRFFFSLSAESVFIKGCKMRK